jgi:gamma-glutamyltranspeptidase/glutathione hydrolase
VLLNVLDHGMTAQEAVDAPRIHHQWIPDKIAFEKGGLVRDVEEALRRRGHELEPRERMGDAHIIYIDPI